MSSSKCVTQSQLTQFLFNVQETYQLFLSGEITSSEAAIIIQQFIDSAITYEFRGGDYSGRLVCLFPDVSCPTVTLNLLYNACLPGTNPSKTSCNDLYQVSITFVPSPNGKQALALVPTSDQHYNDGRVTMDGICQGVSVYHLKNKSECDVETTDCLIICGGDVKSCDSKDGLDFLSFLCNRFGFDFMIKRDRRGKLWLIANQWNEEDIGYDHREAIGENEARYYINYERLRCFFERKSCFKFDDCDPAQLATFTRCYEIWIVCQGGTLVVVYAAKEYRRLPKCFREIVETCNFECFPVDEQTSAFMKSHHEVTQTCVGNYNCVRKLYCCALDKKDDCNEVKFYKHEYGYNGCCRKHAREHQYKKSHKYKPDCGSNKKCDYDDSKCETSSVKSDDSFVAHATFKC